MTTTNISASSFFSISFVSKEIIFPWMLLYIYLVLSIIYNQVSWKNPVWCLKQELTILSTCSCIYFVVEITRCTWVHPSVISGVRVTRSLVLCVMFCRSLFVLLFFFFWPWCCLSFDLWILIIPFVFANYSYSSHKCNLFASIKSTGFLIQNMLQSASWELTDVISLNAVI